jgi:hypothetical protein
MYTGGFNRTICAFRLFHLQTAKLQRIILQAWLHCPASPQRFCVLILASSTLMSAFWPQRLCALILSWGPQCSCYQLRKSALLCSPLRLCFIVLAWGTLSTCSHLRDTKSVWVNLPTELCVQVLTWGTLCPRYSPQKLCELVLVLGSLCLYVLTTGTRNLTLSSPQRRCSFSHHSDSLSGTLSLFSGTLFSVSPQRICPFLTSGTQFLFSGNSVLVLTSRTLSLFSPQRLCPCSHLMDSVLFLTSGTSSLFSPKETLSFFSPQELYRFSHLRDPILVIRDSVLVLALSYSVLILVSRTLSLCLFISQNLPLFSP